MKTTTEQAIENAKLALFQSITLIDSHLDELKAQKAHLRRLLDDLDKEPRS